jgi:hydrogenase maturation protein HypF
MELKKIKLPFKIKKPILALGSQSKNTICFARDNFAILSSVHPDLSNYKDFLNFQKIVKYFLKKNPKIIAYDLHPEYQSTKYALQLHATRYTLHAIQHHHAHIASCMLENKLSNQKVIGVAFDGTGLGIDNTIWGAEFLLCGYKNFKRRAYLRQIPLLGGQRAILEPWRLAAFWLYLIYKDRFLNLKINFVKGMDKNKWQVLRNMNLAAFNSPLASSMGRLFDAVATLVLEKYKVNFEAELAMELEKIATRYLLAATPYNFKIMKNKDAHILDPLPMFQEIVSDLQHKESQEKIAYRFHLTVARMISKICLILRKETKINNVVLSGGVFQNKLLTFLSLGLLYKEDFNIFTHKDLPCTDSSISLGQAVIASFSR